MSQDADPIEEPRRLPRWADRPQVWASTALLLVLPLALALVGYQRPELCGDALFYGYQLERMGEVGGRWWQIADDPQLGQPYQTEMARNPSLFEGLDLLLIAALPSRFLDPRQTYYLAALAALAFNGWVAGGIVRRFSRSTFWAALTVVLVTWNHPTATRYLGHLHLLKTGWAVLAVWMFAEYLHDPTRRRGVLLGLAMAGVLQSSFYFGFLLGLAMGLWWMGCLVARRVERRHLLATGLAGLTFAVVGAALTFPVWTTAKSYYFADDYFHRPWSETWWFGAELWQYLVPPNSLAAAEFMSQVHARDANAYWEGWYFPGYTVLCAIALYVVARLRGWRLWPARAHVLDVFMGLITILVVLSLAGGPSYFLFQLVPSFRAYGRAGLIATALGYVAAPLVLQGMIAAVRSRLLRVAALAGVVALAAFDARRAVLVHGVELSSSLNDAREYIEGPTDPNPAWVDWLAQQPPDVRLVAFSPIPPDLPVTMNTWGIPNLRHRSRHRHATLNGCNLRLFEGDLKLLGASYKQMNPAGLRFLVALGYETLAFDRKYLRANSWIESQPGLDWIAQRGEWRIARANSYMNRFPTQSLERMLTEQPRDQAPVVVPRHVWITGRLEVDRETVVPENGQALMAWSNAKGELIDTPYNALFQHIFGPGIPAFTIQTPKMPGNYELVFLDRSRRRLASKPYLVVATPPRNEPLISGKVSALSVNAVVQEIDPASSKPLRLVLENTSSYYLPALVEWGPICRSVRAQPGLIEPGLGSVVFGVRVKGAGGRTLQELKLVLPNDVPPRGRLELELPTDHLVPTSERVQVTIAPMFLQCKPRKVAETLADVRLTVSTGPDAQPSSAAVSADRPLLR
ncbi:MAG: hypothetical protein P4L84_12030 [Isosphaeraceae bacterium]|nr:hypothetical protein [Isosphaeraceae bacterium]